MQRQTVSRPVSLFCIAAPADAALLAQWETHLLPLQQAGLLTCWSERHLQAGDDRTKLSATHLTQADYLILLLSADFFADNDCLALMHEALVHQHENHLRVIPLLIRPVEWQESALGAFPCLPSNGVAITIWEHPDMGWQQAVQGIRRMLGLLSPRVMAPPDKRATTDRERMARLLRRTYQATLDGSLQSIAWISLGLAEHPNAVRNATHLLQRLPDHSERILPADISILDAYDQAEESLLILGDPGAGKSTLLLDLALRLLERAETDETYPLPVILPLSSWAVSKPELSDWMVKQLARIYDVPRKLGQQWVHQGQILPLLDGLDEMEETARPSCIAAINTYRTVHFTPLVACSRSAEYHTASAHQRLLLQNAIVVQPLTQEQVEQIIQQGGESLAALREALGDSQELRDLTGTPLMLSILILSYYGTAATNLPQQRVALEHRIWTDYVERMVREKGAERQGKGDVPIKCYPLDQTRSWLSWLAQQMRAHDQTLFYGESLLEDWLPVSQYQAVKWLVGRLPAVLLGTCASLLLSFFFVGSINLTTLYQIGLVGGFLGWCVYAEQREKTFTGVQLSWWKDMLQVNGLRLLSVGGLALLVAACFSLNLSGQYYVLTDRVSDGVISGGCILVSAWLLQLVFLRLSSLPTLPLVSSASHWAHLSGWLRTTPVHQALWTAMILGVCMAVSYTLRAGLSDGLNLGVGLGGSYALSYGGTTYLVNIILDMQTRTGRLAERLSWTWHNLLRFQHLRVSLIVTLACLCFFGLSAGLSEELELSAGLSTGVIIGLSTGLSYGVTIGLSYWVFLGLYQGLTQNHLEEQDRHRFNQGLHHSLRNGLLLSLFGAVIIAGMGILSNGLAFGLNDGLGNGLAAGLNNGLSIGVNNGLSHLMNYGLPVGLNNALGYGWLFLLWGWLVLWAAMGGLMVLRHYTLRLLLDRSHTFPLQARRFLDDATARVLLRRQGSGYGFVHRRLLDFFADTALVSADTSDAAHQAPPVPQSLSVSVPETAPPEGLQDIPFLLPE